MARNQVAVGNTTQVVFREIKKLNKTLHEFLLSCGVTPKDGKLSTLIKELNNIVAIKPGIEYIHLKTNSQGYITSFEELGDVLQKTKIPADITRGYYKLENGKIVADELMKRKLWEA